MPRKKASAPQPDVPAGLPTPESGKVWLKVSQTQPVYVSAPVEQSPELSVEPE